MRYMLLLALALAACAESSAPDPTGPAVPSEAASEGPEALPAAPPSGDPAAGADTLRSVYTDLDLDACTVLEEYEEGGGVALRCPGYAGVPLYVTEGDLRFDVDVGVPNDRWDSQAAFNSLGERVEWRLDNGAPYAIILRYHMDSGLGEAGSRWSELAVITVGRENEPGCLVGWVPGDAAPSQNEAARALTDRAHAGRADCLE